MFGWKKNIAIGILSITTTRRSLITINLEISHFGNFSYKDIARGIIFQKIRSIESKSCIKIVAEESGIWLAKITKQPRFHQNQRT